MAYGDLKVRNLIWNTGSGDNTVVLNTLATQSYVTTGFAPKANPTFTGTPRVPEPASSSNDTQVATTAFVKGKVEQSILTASKLYVQDNEPSFNAFDEIWIETDTGSIYKSVAGTSTVPLDSSLVSSSSSNITIPAAGASDTRLSLSAGSPSGTVNLSPSVFLESTLSSLSSLIPLFSPLLFWQPSLSALLVLLFPFMFSIYLLVF